MSSYILVHGAWHGSWCWNKLTPLLEVAEHSVEARDLPGHGKDTTPPEDATLEAYVNSVCDQLDRAKEPVVLVGHSMAGCIISQVAERRPDKIRTLVYVAAVLLQNGQSLHDVISKDEESLVPPNLVVSEDEKTVLLKDDMIKPALYAQCSDEDVAQAKLLLTKQALAPLVTPVEISDGNFGSVKRAYVECSKDRTFSIKSQRMMQSALPCDPVFTIDTDHSPAMSAVEELSRHLLSLA
ncbi:MAG: alpha/beta fold hydrolase [Candidatus Mycalebacterium zealandia]|nr:MAG: alpha/beta fold hydrolase [Candidatus Mycalebacterium zealandia]